MQIRRIKVARLNKQKLLPPIFIEEASVDSASQIMPLPVFIQPTAGGDLVWYGWHLLETLSPSAEVSSYFFARKESRLAILAAIAHFIRYRRELYPIEVARIVQYLVENVPASKRLQRFFNITGQKNFELWLDNYNHLLEIVPTLQNYLISHKAPLKLWLTWSKWESSAQELLAQLYHHLNPTLSQAILITNLVHDLAASERTPVAKILSSAAALPVLTMPSAQFKSRSEALIETLRRRRFPNITAYETRLRQLREQLPHHKCIQISWDPNFEMPGLQLTFNLQKSDDLRLLTDFDREQNLSVLRRMLELL